MKRNAHAGRARREGVEFRVLTDDDLADIHLGTLEVLERTGVFVEDEEAREIFAGRRRHGRRQRRRPHPRPRRRAGGPHRSEQARAWPAGTRRTTSCSRPGASASPTSARAWQIVDPYTGELRVPTKQDVADTAKVVDALPNVDVYERAVVAEDVDQRAVHLHQSEAWTTNTSKHGFMGSGNG